MSFEDDLAALNEDFFFREFTFSKTTFRPTPKQEVELADNIIWIDEILILFQTKERIPNETSSENERRWFSRKVVTLGTKQVRDTLTYLLDNESIELENHRGHTFHLDGKKVATTHKIVCYVSSIMLPNDCRMQKYHRSSTAGVIHLIPAGDYLDIIQTLLTPSELSEYLEFREELIGIWKDEVNAVPEQAIIGQYLQGNVQSRPSSEFIRPLSELEHRAEEWDMSSVIRHFPDSITTENQPTDYYSIVKEIAKLKRNELREFKKRFLLSVEKSRANVLVQPYRMASTRTGCGFVFVPLEAGIIPHRRQGLQNMTLACKYDLNMEKCLGVSFAPEPDGWYSVEWCYMEFPWEYDRELDERLKENNPFRESRIKKLGRYDLVSE